MQTSGNNNDTRKIVNMQIHPPPKNPKTKQKNRQQHIKASDIQNGHGKEQYFIKFVAIFCWRITIGMKNIYQKHFPISFSCSNRKVADFGHKHHANVIQ